MIINSYEKTIFLLLVICMVISFYISHLTLFVIYRYKPIYVDDYLNNFFNPDTKITTSDDFPFTLQYQFYGYIFIPLLVMILIFVFNYKIIIKILSKIIKPILFYLFLTLLTSVSLFYYVIFYSSKYMVVTF